MKCSWKREWRDDFGRWFVAGVATDVGVRRNHSAKVNRARQLSETASGKGVNVARVASILGKEVRLLTVAGGVRGRLLRARLKGQKFSARVVSVSAETRICQTLLGGGTATELVEESGR